MTFGVSETVAAVSAVAAVEAASSWLVVKVKLEVDSVGEIELLRASESVRERLLDDDRDLARL